jgi:hypothetical protein
MVEVFKTNVEQNRHANVLVCLIHKLFRGYAASFDLQDCDKILRVECSTESVNSALLINLLVSFGFEAEVLSDNTPPDTHGVEG